MDNIKFRILSARVILGGFFLTRYDASSNFVIVSDNILFGV